MKLTLAKDLKLPLDAVTRTFGILAVRGAGKSNTAAVMAEEMFAAHLPFCVIDPVGSWYGLRSSADGTAPGLAIPIFGGKHGDVPLERGAGELIADLVIEKRLTCVLDLSRFESESAKKAFLLAFAQRLYQKNENPLHLFLEEADDYIPQKPMRDEAQLLRAWENIVRRGRARGLGMTLITQRSAAVAKMVLTQVETLFAMRTTGPQDIAAIEAWVKYHQVGKDVLSTLASLEDGEAWVWSPHYLKTMSRHQIRRRETFDSGATPKNVHAKDTRPPATLADIDLASLQERMAATIEKAKQDDPRELRKQVADLKRELASKPAAPPAADTREADAMIKRLSDTVGQLQKTAQATVERELGQLHKHAEAQMFRWTAAEQKAREWLNTLLALRAVPAPAPRPASRRQPLALSHQGLATRSTPVNERSKRPEGVKRPVAGDEPALGRGQQKVLTAIAQHGDVGVTREQLTVLTGYKRSSRDTYLQQLLQRALIATNGHNTLVVTAVGEAVLGPAFEALPTGDALREHWLTHLPSGERRVLETVVAAYPQAIERDAISQATDYRRSSRDTYLQKLAARKLVVTDRGAVRASEELFS